MSVDTFSRERVFFSIVTLKTYATHRAMETWSVECLLNALDRTILLYYYVSTLGRQSNRTMKTVDLIDGLLKCWTREEMEHFLQDLCTPQERRSLQERWRVCQLLAQGDLSYRQIHDQTGASLTTIGRVARFLNDEPHHGYQAVLNKITPSQ